MLASPGRARTWILVLALAAALTAGALLFANCARNWPEVFGEVGPAYVPVILDPELRMEGALGPGEHQEGEGVWTLTRVDPPQASPTELRVAVHWDAGNLLHTSATIPLGTSKDAQARVEFSRSSPNGAVYSHGRGLRGVVRINRTTVPKGGEAPMLIELALTDYDGGSEGDVGAHIVLRAEEFR